MDGFDPGDGRKIYSGSIGYRADKSSLYELMNFDDDNNPSTISINLVEKLRNAPYGFDVTLVNFPVGADYVERNAMAVVALLQRESGKLVVNGSSEQISIVGPSMGGLVARYVLAYMEKNNIPHNTKLFVSFDSPHLGANIPISTQENLYFYGYYGEKEKAKEKFNENFRSPAARQMLTEQLDAIQQEAPYSSNLWFSPLNGQNDNTRFRNLFKIALATYGLPNSNGFPVNLRKIAILNGTGNGTKTNAEGLTCLKMEGFRTIKWAQIFGTSITTTLKVVTLDDRFLSTSNNWSQTFKGKVTFPVKLGQIFGTNIPGPPSVIEGWINRKNINPRGSMDVVQGGLFETMDIIQNEFTTELNQVVLDGDLSYFEWPINLHKHAFIPSVSALAFKNSSFDWSSAFNRNLVCDPTNKEIPFDSYFIPSTNEDHVKVTPENANWLIKELQGIPQAQSFPLDNVAITGPNVICENTNTTFSFPDICKVTSAVTWSVTANAQIVSQTGYSVVVKGVTKGSVTLTATFQNGQTLVKKIWYGKPQAEATWHLYPEIQWKNRVCFSTSTPFAEQGVTLTLNPGFLGGCYRGFLIEDLQDSGIGGFTITNICGSVTITPPIINGRSGKYDNESFYKTYPNPTNNIINIELKNSEDKPEDNSIIFAELYNMMGEVKRNITVINNIAVVDVLGLPTGIYVLKINIDGVIESHQVAIE